MVGWRVGQAKGSRPLIFSQWTQVLDVLQWLLDQLGLPYQRLDGSTAVTDRQNIVDQCAPASLPNAASLCHAAAYATWVRLRQLAVWPAMGEAADVTREADSCCCGKDQELFADDN